MLLSFIFNSICVCIFFTAPNLLNAFDHPKGYSLRQVQVFFRHGERIPTSYITFPNEALTNQSIPYEKGEMTNNGKMQEYELGLRFRQIYGEFYGDEYKSLELKVNSGWDNRTILSAQLSMAGFLPPKNSAIWNDKLLWNPIPVFADEIIDDVSFGVFEKCKSLRSDIEGSEGYQNLSSFYSKEMKKLELSTELEIPNAYIFQKVIDTIISRSFLTYLMPLPEWASNPDYLIWIKSLQVGLHSQFIDLFLNPIGGWHLDQIISRIDEYINKRIQQKIIFYAGHDANILTIGRYFGIELIDELMPSYAAFIAFELYEDSIGDYFIELRFLPDLNSSSIMLEFSDCKRPCKLEHFKSLFQSRITSEQWKTVCLGANNESNCTYYGSIIGIFIILFVLALSAAISLLWSCCKYKRHFESLDHDLHKPLIQRQY